MDFAIHVFGRLEVAGITFLITETLVSIWIVMAILISLAVYVRVKSKNWDATSKPSGLQNFLELCVDVFSNLVRNTVGEKMAFVTPWFFALFTFIMISNMIGITGIRPPTADWGLTFPLALTSFCLFHYSGLRCRPKSYLRGILLEPIFLFAPINIMGELARPISLSFRLFGNVLGGMILLSLIYGIAPLLLQLTLPVMLHMYFDLAAGILQAFIFTMLSLAIIGLAAGE